MGAYIIAAFLILVVLVLGTLLIQFVKNFKVVGANQIAVVAGKGAEGYQTYHGGRVVVWPLINKRYDLDLRPRTTTVRVESAIAKGMVPLNVVATVSFAVSSSGRVLQNAIRRILAMAQDWEELTSVASSIIEGHLRDSIATMTPEQVMRDKEELVRNMISVCKEDLEAIGLEITTMNIADVEDHRLQGMGDGELYIDLLNRIQAANAESQARASQAEARAASTEESEARRADVETRQRDNKRESLHTETSAKVAEENQRGTVGEEQAKRNAEANEAGVRGQIEAEQQRIEKLRAQFEAEIDTPAAAEKDRRILQAQQDAAELKGKAQAEIDQLKRTIEILQAGGQPALQAYLIDNFDSFIKPFARTLDLFPADKITVLSGANDSQNEPISAVDPHPVEHEKARVIREAFASEEVAAAASEATAQRQHAVPSQTAGASTASAGSRGTSASAPKGHHAGDDAADEAGPNGSDDQ
jgi:uncharacterized membrane protein YqiK